MADESANSSDVLNTVPVPVPVTAQQTPSSLPETSPLLAPPSVVPSLPPEGVPNVVLDQPPEMSSTQSQLPYPTDGQMDTNVTGQSTTTNLPYPIDPSGSVSFTQTPGLSSTCPPPTTNVPSAPTQSQLPPSYTAPQYTGYGATGPGANTVDYNNKQTNFVMPPPPPTYEESTYNIRNTAPPTQQYVVGAFCDYPMQMKCPHCQSNILTEVEYSNGGLVYLCVIILILMGLWIFCCCLVPLFIDGLKDVSHICPNCKTLLGRHNKM